MRGVISTLKRGTFDVGGAAMIPYAIGLDVGITSVGWAVVALNEDDAPYGILDMGVRIFDVAEQPKTGASLAAPRREARSARRRLRRRSHQKDQHEQQDGFSVFQQNHHVLVDQRPDHLRIRIHAVLTDQLHTHLRCLIELALQLRRIGERIAFIAEADRHRIFHKILCRTARNRRCKVRAKRQSITFFIKKLIQIF